MEKNTRGKYSLELTLYGSNGHNFICFNLGSVYKSTSLKDFEVDFGFKNLKI